MEKDYVVVWRQKNERVNTTSSYVKANNAEQAILKIKNKYSSFGELIDVYER